MLKHGNHNHNHNRMVSNETKRARGALAAEFAHEFLGWYERYPHKIGKAKAAKAFLKARKSASPEELAAGLERYITSKPIDRPWCNPATWLNQERWKDQPAEVTQNAGGAQDAGRQRNGLEFFRHE